MSRDAERSQIDGFNVAIDRDADVPVGVQLGWALCAHIRDGRFKPGEQLPTLRDLAEATGLNVNTVRAVYQRMEHKGLVESQQGSGTFVAMAHRGSPHVATIAADAARQASETGVDLRDVAAALYVAPASARPAGDAATAQRRALRQQIAVLERATGELEALYPGVVPRPSSTRGGGGPALLGNDELERVRAQVVRRLAVAQTAIDAHLEAAAREGELTRATAAAGATAAASAADVAGRAAAGERTGKPAGARGGAKRKTGKARKRTTRATPARPAPAGT